MTALQASDRLRALRLQLFLRVCVERPGCDASADPDVVALGLAARAVLTSAGIVSEAAAILVPDLEADVRLERLASAARDADEVDGE